jgi:hypothetical protein
MYVKASVRKTRTGEVRYLQLARNEWDLGKGRSVPRVIYGFGREDQLGRQAVRRLVTSLSRLLDPGGLPAVPGEDLQFTESRPCGGACVLGRLGIGMVLAGLASSGRGRPRDAEAAERVLFALVANRALAPSSKLAASEWMSRDVRIDGLGEVSGDACYRAMDWLHAVRGEVEKQVYFQVAGLLNLQVDLIFLARHRPISRPAPRTRRSRGTGAGRKPQARTARARNRPGTARRPRPAGRAGSASTASPRTPAMICPRSWSGWPSPARASRSGSGAGPGTRLIPH